MRRAASKRCKSPRKCTGGFKLSQVPYCDYIDLPTKLERNGKAENRERAVCSDGMEKLRIENHETVTGYTLNSQLFNVTARNSGETETVCSTLLGGPGIRLPPPFLANPRLARRIVCHLIIGYHRPYF